MFKPTKGTAAWKAGGLNLKTAVSVLCFRTCDSFIPSQPVSVVRGTDGGEVVVKGWALKKGPPHILGQWHYMTAQSSVTVHCVYIYRTQWIPANLLFCGLWIILFQEHSRPVWCTWKYVWVFSSEGISLCRIHDHVFPCAWTPASRGAST